MGGLSSLESQAVQSADKLLSSVYTIYIGWLGIAEFHWVCKCGSMTFMVKDLTCSTHVHSIKKPLKSPCTWVTKPWMSCTAPLGGPDALQLLTMLHLACPSCGITDQAWSLCPCFPAQQSNPACLTCILARRSTQSARGAHLPDRKALPEARCPAFWWLPRVRERPCQRQL